MPFARFGLFSATAGQDLGSRTRRGLIAVARFQCTLAASPRWSGFEPRTPNEAVSSCKYCLALTGNPIQRTARLQPSRLWENSATAAQRAEPGDEAVGPRGLLLRPLAAGAAVTVGVRVGPLLADVAGKHAFVRAIITLGQVRLSFGGRRDRCAGPDWWRHARNGLLSTRGLTDRS